MEEPSRGSGAKRELVSMARSSSASRRGTVSFPSGSEMENLGSLSGSLSHFWKMEMRMGEEMVITKMISHMVLGSLWPSSGQYLSGRERERVQEVRRENKKESKPSKTPLSSPTGI